MGGGGGGGALSSIASSPAASSNSLAIRSIREIESERRGREGGLADPILLTGWLSLKIEF